MGMPKITHNENYDDDGERVMRITAEGDVGKLREIIDKSKFAYVEESNPYNTNGQPIRHTDNRTGTVYLTYYGMGISDAIVVGAPGSRSCFFLQFFLKNGERVPYTCRSKGEFEWLRKGLGQSSLDRSPFKV